MFCKGENRTVRIAVVLLLTGGVAFAQVQNAADANAGVYASSGVAPGSQAFVADSFGGALPSVNGAVVSIRPVGSSTAIPAEVLGANANGIAFIVPPDVPLGNAQLIYNQSGQLGQWTSVSIVPSHFALYRNPVRAVNINASGPANPNGLANPAQPGQTVEIFATGLSAIPQSPPIVTVGGVLQAVTYAGSGGPPGLLQINFQISPATIDGCYLPLTVTWAGNTAGSYISKTSDGMPCHHPFGLSTQALQALDDGNTVQTGLVDMSSALTAASTNHASRTENVSALFSDFSAAQIANYFTASPALGCGGNEGGSPILLNGFFFGGGPFGDSMTLQHGATTLTLQPADIFSVVSPPTADAPLNSLPAPLIGGGAWTWSSSFGSFGFTLPTPAQIVGGAPIEVQTGQDQTIAWNGSGFDSGAILQLFLSAQNYGPPTITCFAPALTGSLTIPSALLSQFTPGEVGVLSVTVNESGANIPHANFPVSGGLLMLMIDGSTDTRPVDFK